MKKDYLILDSLQRERGEMIHMHKILTDSYQTSWFTNPTTRQWRKKIGHSQKNFNTFKNWFDIDLKCYYSSPELCVKL